MDYFKEKRIRELLYKCGFENISVKTINTSRGKYVDIKFSIKTQMNHTVEAFKTLNNEEELNGFIQELETLYYINVLGPEIVNALPSGGLYSPGNFYFEFHDKDGNNLSYAEVKYILEKNISKSKGEVYDTLLRIKSKSEKIIKSNFKIRSIKENYESKRKKILSSKEKIQTVIGKISFMKEKIPNGEFENMVITNFFEKISIKDIVEILKTGDINKLNELLKDIQKSIFNNNLLQFDFSFDIDKEDIVYLRYFFQILEECMDKTIEEQESIITSYSKSNEELSDKIDKLNLLPGNESVTALEQMENPSELEEYHISGFSTAFNVHEPVRYINKSEFKEIDYSSEMFKTLEMVQAETLTKEEKDALMLYKTQLYRPMNMIISYLRENNKKLEEELDNEEIIKFIKISYNELLEQQKETIWPKINDSTVRTRADEIFQRYPGKIPNFEQYKQLVLTSIPFVESALKKVTIDEDIVVYRGINGSSFDQYGSSFISTTMDPQVANIFISDRARPNKGSNFKYIARILIPKGSCIIAYTSELITGREYSFPFGDAQKEILIDSANFDFKYVKSSAVTILYKDGKERTLSYEDYIAIPKHTYQEDNDIDGMTK